MEIDKTKLKRRFLALREKLKLTQEEISDLFDVHVNTWKKWEHGLVLPFPRHIKLLEEFEKRPPKPLTLSDMCRAIRIKSGFKKYQMAELFNVAPNTWGNWERGQDRPITEHIEKIKKKYEELKESEILQKAS